MKLEVLNPHGFCAGVAGALRKAHALAAEGQRVYCYHQIVHNEAVVRDLEQKGFIFIEDLSQVPEGEIVLFSAHGVSPAVRAEAIERKLRIVDATCPFVARVHQEARALAERGLPVVIIGDARHDEVKGIRGEVPSAFIWPDLPTDVQRIGVVCQTTMNAAEVEKILDELRTRYTVETSASVCRATQERQDAVRAFTGDALLVLGSRNSSNTRRLAEVANCPAFRAGSMEELKRLPLSDFQHLGVTSGASTPEDFLARAIRYLQTEKGAELA